MDSLHLIYAICWQSFLRHRARQVLLAIRGLFSRVRLYSGGPHPAHQFVGSGLWVASGFGHCMVLSERHCFCPATSARYAVASAAHLGRASVAVSGLAVDRVRSPDAELASGVHS